LQKIEERDSSILAAVSKPVKRVLGFPDDIAFMQTEVRGAFSKLTGSVQTQVTKVLLEAQRERGKLGELKDLLVSIAIAALRDSKILEKERLKEKSYWKWILRSHREKISDFDVRVEMCASFYRYTEEALNVVELTHTKLQELMGQLTVFRDGLQNVGLSLEHGGEVSPQLSINMLKTSVERLEETRKSTKLLKGERMRRLEATYKT